MELQSRMATEQRLDHLVCVWIITYRISYLLFYSYIFICVLLIVVFCNLKLFLNIDITINMLYGNSW